MSDDPNACWSVDDTARHFGYHPQSWWRLVREGKVRKPRGISRKKFYTKQDRDEIEEESKR